MKSKKRRKLQQKNLQKDKTTKNSIKNIMFSVKI